MQQAAHKRNFCNALRRRLRFGPASGLQREGWFWRWYERSARRRAWRELL